MKKLAFLILICLTGKVIGQNCIPLAIVFTSQNQVDSFPINYPGCVVIDGSLGVLGDGITNLNGLNQLVEIGGSVQILNANNLMDLGGLDNLTKIGGQFILMGGRFTNFNGIGKLKEIGSHFIVSENDSLQNFSGIDSLRRIEGDFDFKGGSKFVNFNGLSKLDSIFGKFVLRGNIPICTGLSALRFIGGEFRLGGNIASLIGLNSLKNIGGAFIVVETLLPDYSGLDSLQNIGGNLFSVNNANLGSFLGLNSLRSIHSLYIIENTNIISLSGLDSLDTIGEDMTITIQNVNSPISLNPLGNLSNFNGSITLQGNFSDLEVFAEFDTLSNISISDNDIITNISGFDSLKHLGGLSISNNPILVAITGFESLQSLGPLDLMNNQFLVSIEGLNHPVIYTAQYLRISDNTILDNCNIEFLCDIVWQYNGQITLAIQGNGVNCGSISSIAQSCGNAPDSDGDGVNDFLDNCPNTQNANQLDCNNNGIGDACEPLDSDCDGIIDSLDNCPNYPNPFQTDLNNNTIGDACEDFPKIGINQTNPKSEFHLSNGSIFIDNPEKGIIFKNHQGQCYTFKANENILQVVYIPCPQ